MARTALATVTQTFTAAEAKGVAALGGMVLAGECWEDEDDDIFLNSIRSCWGSWSINTKLTTRDDEYMPMFVGSANSNEEGQCRCSSAPSAC